MIANMPSDSFYFYYVFYWVQFVFVVGYGLWWYFSGKKEDMK